MSVKIGSTVHNDADAVEVRDLNAEEHGSPKSRLSRVGLIIDDVQVIGVGVPILTEAVSNDPDDMLAKINEIVQLLIRNKQAVGISPVEP